MKKAFDQTVRDLKRGVNKKVLKVPTIEQKVLDATSNETWGPHGSLLADIAMASRNYHEYQMIISIIWKRINDTGKNWRHVYKSLSEFQYLDHTGRDQGNNVRKKSQSLVALVNDKERILEVRQKAAANWDKFHNTSGGRRPGSYPGAGGYVESVDESSSEEDEEEQMSIRDDTGTDSANLRKTIYFLVSVGVYLVIILVISIELVFLSNICSSIVVSSTIANNQTI